MPSREFKNLIHTDLSNPIHSRLLGMHDYYITYNFTIFQVAIEAIFTYV